MWRRCPGSTTRPNSRCRWEPSVPKAPAGKPSRQEKPLGRFHPFLVRVRRDTAQGFTGFEIQSFRCTCGSLCPYPLNASCNKLPNDPSMLRRAQHKPAAQTPRFKRRDAPAPRPKRQDRQPLDVSTWLNNRPRHDTRKLFLQVLQKIKVKFILAWFHFPAHG